MLALTPAHFILSRYALDYLYPLPFLLGWLLCVISYLENGRCGPCFAGTVLLGIGFLQLHRRRAHGAGVPAFTRPSLFHQGSRA